MSADIWPVVHAERRSLAQDLVGLTPEQWQTASLCTRWTVEQVLAHQAATARLTAPAFLAKMLAAGFSFTRFTDKEIARIDASGSAGTLASFAGAESLTCSPPGPKLSWVGETIVHAEDIRRPLGLQHAYPTDWVVRTTEFYAGSNVLIGGKSRVAGVTLRATDADWAHGEGPVVEGPALALLMATAGRKQYLDDLTGPGVGVLRGR